MNDDSVEHLVSGLIYVPVTKISYSLLKIAKTPSWLIGVAKPSWEPLKHAERIRRKRSEEHTTAQTVSPYLVGLAS